MNANYKDVASIYFIANYWSLKCFFAGLIKNKGISSVILFITIIFLNLTGIFVYGQCDALDIYGTILALNDPDNSDGRLPLVKSELLSAKFNLGWFDRFYELKDNPKNYSQIIRDYKIGSQELLVIGDSDKDIIGAMKIGALRIRVPQYIDGKDNFDLSGLVF